MEARIAGAQGERLQRVGSGSGRAVVRGAAGLAAKGWQTDSAAGADGCETGAQRQRLGRSRLRAARRPRQATCCPRQRPLGEAGRRAPRAVAWRASCHLRASASSGTNAAPLTQHWHRKRRQLGRPLRPSEAGPMRCCIGVTCARGPGRRKRQQGAQGEGASGQVSLFVHQSRRQSARRGEQTCCCLAHAQAARRHQQRRAGIHLATSCP